MREWIGSGAEQVVYGFPQHTAFKDIVIKEAKMRLPWRAALLSRLLVGSGELSNLLTWREVGIVKRMDNVAIVDILGGYALPAFYIHGYASDGHGMPTNYCVQERIKGKSLLEVTRERPHLILQNSEVRSSLLKIAWGSKLVTIQLGAPPDFHGGRNIMLTVDNRVVLIDTGFPSFLARVASSVDLPLLVRYYCVAIIEYYLKYIIHLEHILSPTLREERALAERFRVSTHDFQSAMLNITRMRHELQNRIKLGRFIACADSLLRFSE